MDGTEMREKTRQPCRCLAWVNKAQKGESKSAGIRSSLLSWKHLPVPGFAFCPVQSEVWSLRDRPAWLSSWTSLSPLSVSAAGLYFICKALEKDYRYSKGLVLKEKIFQEQPSLRKDSLRMFLKW